MSCETASQNATPPGSAIAPGAGAVDVRAAAGAIGSGGWEWPGGGRGAIDPRVAALVPGFDAPFFQAGLAGYSDGAMRIIARRHGCPFCVTEALLDRTLLAGGRGFDKADLGELRDNVPGGAEDAPLACQIMGSEPREMAAAAVKAIEQRARSDKAYRVMAYEADAVPAGVLRLPGGEQIRGESDDGDGEAQPDGSFAVIDVNLACPVKKIERKARGGHWLSEPRGAIELLEAVREAVPGHIPCTVKLRRSFDDTPEMVENFHRVFDAAYGIGYAWATVHARTVLQKYVGPSRWTFLKDLRERYPDRVFFGSGDVWGVEDIFRMIAYAGVSGVSVARGCIGNPWIFRQARDMMAGGPPRPPTVAEQREVLREHFRLSLACTRRYRQPEAATSMMMRKFGIRFAQHHPRAEAVRKRFIAVASTNDWMSVLDDEYASEA
ncbi:MAG TPA: tRNA-dihydrouridine synthase family protein [Phycisphaerales bacterium]|nr:tRNA-dihydrouridine synthase family protein [Phycisphaerales bacterium]